MKQEIEIKMSEYFTYRATAKLWQKGSKKRWYVNSKDGNIVLDANTGQQLKCHGQVNNERLVKLVKEQLGI